MCLVASKNLCYSKPISYLFDHLLFSIDYLTILHPSILDYRFAIFGMPDLQIASNIRIVRTAIER